MISVNIRVVRIEYKAVIFLLAVEMIRSKIEQEKLILLREQDQDRDAYQKLLTERNILEARVEALEKELMNQGHGHYRSLSDASTISIQDNSRGSPDGTASVVAEVRICLIEISPCVMKIEIETMIFIERRRLVVIEITSEIEIIGI